MAPCAEQERAKARTGYAPTARCGTGLVRTTGRASALLFDSSADVGFLAGWLGARCVSGWPLRHAAPAGRRRTGRCLADGAAGL